MAQAPTKRKRIAPPPAAAQPTGDKDAWPIESLTVEGNSVYTKEQILGVAALKIGQTVVPKDFEAARLRLLATGAFQSAGYTFERMADGKGYHGNFKVLEESQMFPVMFEQLPAKDEELLALLTEKDPLFGPKVPATQPFVERYNALIQEYVDKLGFKGTVKGRLTNELTPEPVILFRPSKPREVVAEVQFSNTGDVPAPKLQNAIAPVAVGVGFTEARMRQWLETSVKPLYEARGRLRATFPTITTTPAKRSNGLAVAVTVDQGPVYKIEAVKLTGAEDMGRYAKPLKVGEVANFDILQTVKENILASLNRRGFLHAAVKSSRTLDNTKLTATVSVLAEPGPQFLMGSLTIHGLDLLSEPEIRKLWGLGEGKPYNVEYPDYFLKVVRDENLFENLGKTHPVTNIHEDTKIVDVDLFFEGARGKKKDPAGP